MKYESNTPMFSKDIALKPFFVRTGHTYVRTRVMLYAPPHNEQDNTCDNSTSQTERFLG